MACEWLTAYSQLGVRHALHALYGDSICSPRKVPSKTNVPFQILRTGTVCRYFLRICVCQGQYSVGTAGWCTLNSLCSYNEHGHHQFTIRETVVPLPSLRRGLKLICVHMRPAQCQTIVPTFQWSVIVQVSYEHISTLWVAMAGRQRHGNLPNLELTMVLLIATT